MKNIMLKVSYDGTNYSGWQIQENAITVEEKITEAIYLLTGERVKVIGSGRTDKEFMPTNKYVTLRLRVK